MREYKRNAVISVSIAVMVFSIMGFVQGTYAQDSKQQAKAVSGERLAMTPPMGWNSWNALGKKVSEQLVRETADAMVSSGMKDAGYSYVVIDDIWQGGRDSVTGLLYPDAKRFPSGMKALADYVHSKGLLFGMYSDAGTQTCGRLPGSFGYEEKDAQTFADWGADFLKYDYCFCNDYASTDGDYRRAVARYGKMGEALKATGRPIVFSICEWGDRSPWQWGREVGGHMWRISSDVYDIWDSPRSDTDPVGILAAIDASTDLRRFAGPGGWNDPDMLVVGLKNTGNIRGGGCNDIEYRTQMSMWCMLAAPLMVGCDIRKMDAATKTILLNKEIIAIDQDPLGKQGFRVMRRDGFDAWKKPLSGKRVAIAFLNRYSTAKAVTATWKELDLDPQAGYTVYDVWKHAPVRQSNEKLSANLKPHECQVFVLTPSESK